METITIISKTYSFIMLSTYSVKPFGTEIADTNKLNRIDYASLSDLYNRQHISLTDEEIKYVRKQLTDNTGGDGGEFPSLYTVSVNGKDGVVRLTTDDVPQGPTKLYYSASQVRRTTFTTKENTKDYIVGEEFLDNFLDKTMTKVKALESLPVIANTDSIIEGKTNKFFTENNLKTSPTFKETNDKVNEMYAPPVKRDYVTKTMVTPTQVGNTDINNGGAIELEQLLNKFYTTQIAIGVINTRQDAEIKYAKEKAEQAQGNFNTLIPWMAGVDARPVVNVKTTKIGVTPNSKAIPGQGEEELETLVSKMLYSINSLNTLYETTKSQISSLVETNIRLEGEIEELEKKVNGGT